MNPEQLLHHFDRISEAPDAIPRLRRFILDLAVRGKLVEQDPNDEPATELLKRIQDGKARLVKEGVIKKAKPVAPIYAKELPFASPIKWQFIRLGDVLEMINGRAFKPTDWIASGLPIVRIQNLNNVHAPFNFCDPESIDERHLIRDNEFLISWSGTPGTSFGAFIWVRGLAALNQHIFRCIQIGDSYWPEFLRLAINSQLDVLISKAQGGVGLQHVTKGTLESLPIPLPPLAEQHRIVAKVDELMALCDRLEAAQTEREQCRDRLVAASLNRLNQSDQSRRPGMDCRDPDFMDESDLGSFPPDSNPKQQNVSSMEGKQAYIPVNWIPAIPAGTTGFDDVRFVLDNLPRLTTRPAHIKQLRQTILNLAVRGKLAPQDSKDEPAAELLNRIKVQRVASELKSKIKNVGESCASYSKPRGWEWCEIEALSKLVTDGEHATPIRIREHEIPLVTAKNVRDGEMDYSITDWVSRETAEKAWKRCKPEVGDILLVCVGATTGRLCILREAKEMVLVRSVALIRPEIGIDVNYLALAIRSPLGQTQIWGSVKATAQPCLYINKINNLSFPLPPLAEQHRIVAKVDELMALCDQLETQLTRTAADSRRLLEALLHEALVPASEQAA